ncbi:MAG: hypothetical protein WDO71_03690 [Bacteroidota bacterium]
MKRKLIHLLYLGLLYSGYAFSQTTAPSELPAQKNDSASKNDGLLNEPAWKDCSYDE